jgi:hypothetical protein
MALLYHSYLTISLLFVIWFLSILSLLFGSVNSAGGGLAVIYFYKKTAGIL